jgi:hypothetical protein
LRIDSFFVVKKRSFLKKSSKQSTFKERGES